MGMSGYGAYVYSAFGIFFAAIAVLYVSTNKNSILKQKVK